MKNIKGWMFPAFDNLLSTKVDDYPITKYQQEAIDIAYKYCKKFEVAVDVGANVGLHTVRFAEKFNRVVAFEPESENFNCLQANTKNFKNVVIHKMALGNNEGQLHLRLPKGNNNCGAYSFIDFNNREDSELLEQTVDITMLDKFSLAPDLIKMDVQSYEKFVVLGAESTLKNNEPVLIVEMNKKLLNDMTNFFAEFGYHFAERYSKDFIWIKK
jgi:FkbM family methyltransferase